MARRLVLVAASLALGLAASPAKASNCATDEYDHNGSLMEMQVCDGGGMTISYMRPRRGLTAVGVVTGTLLFNGVEQAGGVISGQARRFDKTCGPVLYPVTGHNHSGSIILRGNAPKLDGRCQVIGYRADKLLFTLQGAVQPPPSGGPAVVAPSCPPGYVLSQGLCVAGGAPAPAPSGGDWYAIGGSFKSRGDAQGRASQFGPGWVVMNTNSCLNMTNGYWIAAAGPFDKATAQLYINESGQGYLKTCH
jgi:hypothetical protein